MRAILDISIQEKYVKWEEVWGGKKKQCNCKTHFPVHKTEIEHSYSLLSRRNAEMSSEINLNLWSFFPQLTIILKGFKCCLLLRFLFTSCHLPLSDYKLNLPSQQNTHPTSEDPKLTLRTWWYSSSSSSPYLPHSASIHCMPWIKQAHSIGGDRENVYYGKRKCKILEVKLQKKDKKTATVLDWHQFLAIDRDS